MGHMNHEPENHDPLNDLLHEWRAPKAPGYLEREIFSRRAPHAPRLSGWRWLLTGSVRIPTPLFAAALIVLIAVLYSAWAHKPTNPAGISSFQPVKSMNVRVVRSDYAN